MTYDGLDRLENKNGTLYAFDYGNRLRQAGPESYRYDAYGRRTRSSSSAGLLYTLYDQHGQIASRIRMDADRGAAAHCALEPRNAKAVRLVQATLPCQMHQVLGRHPREPQPRQVKAEPSQAGTGLLGKVV